MAPENTDEAVELHERASELLEQGSYPEAPALCRRSLELVEQESAPNSPDAVNVRDTLASIQEVLAQYQDTLETRKRAAEIAMTFATEKIWS
jgi:hypothetical protein